MTEMIERVAEAMFRADFPNQYWTGAATEPAYMKSARAAVAAMREPTAQMIKEAWAEATAENAKGVWHAMIDEALK